jgi:hypothetical protein
MNTLKEYDQFLVPSFRIVHKLKLAGKKINNKKFLMPFITLFQVSSLISFDC